MNSRLTSTRFPYLPIQVRIGQSAVDVEVLIDTGFDGALLVPTEQIPRGVRARGTSHWALADGTVVRAPYFDGIVILGPFAPFRVTVVALGNEALLGRAVISRFTVTMIHGRDVIVEP